MSSSEPDVFRVLQAVSHDILEPLRTIRWYADRLDRPEYLPREHKGQVTLGVFTSSVETAQSSFREFYNSFKEHKEVQFYKEYAEEVLRRDVYGIEALYYDLVPFIKNVDFGRRDISIANFRSVVLRLEDRYQELLSLLGLESLQGTKSIGLRNEFVRVTHDLSAAIIDANLTSDNMRVQGQIIDNFNRLRISLIFQNLLANSIKFRSPQRKLKVSLMMWTSPPRAFAHRLEDEKAANFLKNLSAEKIHIIRFADNGIGIDKQYWESVFDSFFRSPNTEKFAGSGMGLSIVKSAVEQEGGRIWIHPKPTAGTNFFIVLPKREGRGSDLSLVLLRDLLTTA